MGLTPFVIPRLKTIQLVGDIRSCLCQMAAWETLAACEAALRARKPFAYPSGAIMHAAEENIMGCIGELADQYLLDHLENSFRLDASRLAQAANIWAPPCRTPIETATEKGMFVPTAFLLPSTSRQMTIGDCITQLAIVRTIQALTPEGDVMRNEPPPMLG